MENPRIIVFGVSGCGKSTIGQFLSDHLSLPFYDADDFHSKENIKKMQSGIPLNDSDRQPWLNSINTKLKNHKKEGFILACSALKQSYRDILSKDIEGVSWVFLNGTYNQILNRLKARKDHFMNPDLLKSQFDTLEIPSYGISVSIEYPPVEIAQKIIRKISG